MYFVGRKPHGFLAHIDERHIIYFPFFLERFSMKVQSTKKFNVYQYKGLKDLPRLSAWLDRALPTYDWILTSTYDGGGDPVSERTTLELVIQCNDLTIIEGDYIVVDREEEIDTQVVSADEFGHLFKVIK